LISFAKTSRGKIAVRGDGMAVGNFQLRLGRISGLISHLREQLGNNHMKRNLAHSFTVTSAMEFDGCRPAAN
jgi:hypothetical protein